MVVLHDLIHSSRVHQEFVGEIEASFAWLGVVAGFHARLFGCYLVKKKARLPWIPFHFN